MNITRIDSSDTLKIFKILDPNITSTTKIFLKDCFSLQIYMNYYLYINDIKGKIHLNNN